VQDDAFAWIDHIRDVSYDLVITDPPSLAKREVERNRATQAYGRLNANAIRLLRGGGILLAASCSAHVSADEFFGAVRQAARQSGRRFEEIEITQHAPDHHATFPEAEYLKGIYLRFD
jgi:23S rRNA (cytosine1962-C5)-methyltransferase